MVKSSNLKKKIQKSQKSQKTVVCNRQTQWHCFYLLSCNFMLVYSYIVFANATQFLYRISYMVIHYSQTLISFEMEFEYNYGYYICIQFNQFSFIEDICTQVIPVHVPSCSEKISFFLTLIIKSCNSFSKKCKNWILPRKTPSTFNIIMICMCLELNRKTVDELIKLFFTPCTQISIFLYVLYDNRALQIYH